MNLRVLHSPLTGTAAVLTGMALLAIPLHQLTSKPAANLTTTPAATPASEPTHPAATTPTVLRLKLLAPAPRIHLSTPAGLTLLALENVPAGESEHDIQLPIDDLSAEFTINATLAPGPPETALFLTLIPDNLPEKTTFLTGNNQLTDTQEVDWK